MEGRAGAGEANIEIILAPRKAEMEMDTRAAAYKERGRERQLGKLCGKERGARGTGGSCN